MELGPGGLQLSVKRPFCRKRAISRNLRAGQFLQQFLGTGKREICILELRLGLRNRAQLSLHVGLERRAL